MSTFGDLIAQPEKEGKEKHVPQIKAPAAVKAGEPFHVTVVVGEEVPHPNTLEHHIKWIQLYAKVAGAKPVMHIGSFELAPTLAAPTVTVPVMLQESAQLIALEYCNVHGVWENSIDISVE